MTDLNLDAPCFNQSHANAGQATRNAFTFLNALNHSSRFPSIGETVKVYLRDYRIPHNHAPTIRLATLLYMQPSLNSSHEALPTPQVALDLIHQLEHNLLTAQSPSASYSFLLESARNLQASDVPNPQFSLIPQPILDHNQLTAPDEIGDYIQVGKGRRITASKRVIIS